MLTILVVTEFFSSFIYEVTISQEDKLMWSMMLLTLTFYILVYQHKSQVTIMLVGTFLSIIWKLPKLLVSSYMNKILTDPSNPFRYYHRYMFKLLKYMVIFMEDVYWNELKGGGKSNYLL